MTSKACPYCHSASLARSHLLCTPGHRRTFEPFVIQQQRRKARKRRWHCHNEEAEEGDDALKVLDAAITPLPPMIFTLSDDDDDEEALPLKKQNEVMEAFDIDLSRVHAVYRRYTPFDIADMNDIAALHALFDHYAPFSQPVNEDDVLYTTLMLRHIDARLHALDE